MFVRSLIPTAAFLTAISGAPARQMAAAQETAPVPDMPSAQEAVIIETHASTWVLVLKREQLRTMTKRWPALMEAPDSAVALFATMLSAANEIVDQLVLSTSFSRTILMRWVEKDMGLKPYFFPPYPEQRVEKKQSELWKILTPILPIILYRLVDRMMN